jgi:hypothetical protein
VRAMMTINQRLTLSEEMLKEIHIWGQGIGYNVIEEEITLAKTIFQDFNTDQFNNENQDSMNEAGNRFSIIADIPLIEDNLINLNLNYHGCLKDDSVYVSGFQKPDTEGILFDILPSKTQINSMLNESNDANNKTDVAKTGRSEGGVACSPQETILNDEKSLDFFFLQVNSLKEEGNIQFKLSQLDLSHTTYSKALNIIDKEFKDFFLSSQHNHGNETTQENQEKKEFLKEIKTLKASLLFNVAMILWKLFEKKEFNLNSKKENCFDDLLACEKAVKACLLIDPQHTKALYRLCEILLKSDRSQEALKIIEEYPSIKVLFTEDLM